jgi:hypothetical protein
VYEVELYFYKKFQALRVFLYPLSEAESKLDGLSVSHDDDDDDKNNNSNSNNKRPLTRATASSELTDLELSLD